MPTKRIMIVAFLTTLGTEIAFHGLFRPWFARNASKPGIAGDLSQAGLLVG
jgi:hypothetical protein